MTPLTAADRRRFTLMSERLERTETLQAGDKGAAVRAMETVLTGLGFAPKVDADFTKHTATTLKAFQSAMGLEATGVLDAGTLAKLNTALTQTRKFPTGVTQGSKGEDVAKVERQLRQLGYDVGTEDGIADATLGKAIKAFKRDQPEFEIKSEVLGEKGQAILQGEALKLRHASFRDRLEPTKQMLAFDATLAELSGRANPDGTVGIGEGATRPAIAQLQARLEAAGFDPRRSDGKFDARTRGALEAFQRAEKLPETGRLDPKTWKALKKTMIYTDQPAAPVQKLLEKSGEVKNTERLLAKAGFHPGKIDGLFSKQTEKAVRAFEAATGRRVDGQIGALDLEKLKQIANTPFPEPKSDYTHVGFRGVTLNQRSVEMLKQAERWAQQHGVPPGWPLFKGSYLADDGNSAGTHEGGGAMDVNVEGLTAKQQDTVTEALRRAGFAAWHRKISEGWDDDHVHAVAIGDRDLSAEGRSQVRDYFNGDDGLSGTARDGDAHLGRPVPAWARRFQ